jgi:predicted nucleotide-binding protein (sugar kinase/HSP70/actin superfamily)
LFNPGYYSVPPVCRMKPKKIGLPRAFYYYLYPSLFETFFRELGFEVVEGGVSTRKTIETAAAVTEAEHCLPNKLFDGHVESLKGKADAVFIPRIISMMKGHIACPRFGALPDATRAWLNDSLPVITIEINETKRPIEKTLTALGKQLGAGGGKAAAAAKKALDAMREKETAQAAAQKAPADGKKCLLLGHPYTLADAFISDPVLRKLRSLHVPVELVTFEDRGLKPKDILWCTFHTMHTVLSDLDTDAYAGVIQISTFNCGADSMMIERFRRLCKRAAIPYMVIMVDEHTGRAGIDTRIEAFVDSLAWRAASRERV